MSKATATVLRSEASPDLPNEDVCCVWEPCLQVGCTISYHGYSAVAIPLLRYNITQACHFMQRAEGTQGVWVPVCHRAPWLVPTSASS